MHKTPPMPPRLRALFIDMDNTLIETQALYEDAHDVLTAFICGCGPFTPEDVLQTVRRREVELFDLYGYGREMLPHAFADTLRHFVPDARPEEIRQARDMAETVYARTAALRDGALEMIERLAPHFTLYLVTVGDDSVQRPRIAALPFKDSFAKTFVVGAKNAGTYRDVLLETGVKPEEAAMIGDSLASDIVPALEAGMTAIYVPAQNWHGREMAGQSLPPAAIPKASLRDVAAWLAPQDNRAAAPAPIQKRKDGGIAPG